MQSLHLSVYPLGLARRINPSSALGKIFNQASTNKRLFKTQQMQTTHFNSTLRINFSKMELTGIIKFNLQLIRAFNKIKPPNLIILTKLLLVRVITFRLKILSIKQIRLTSNLGNLGISLITKIIRVEINNKTILDKTKINNFKQIVKIIFKKQEINLILSNPVSKLMASPLLIFKQKLNLLLIFRQPQQTISKAPSNKIK